MKIKKASDKIHDHTLSKSNKNIGATLPAPKQENQSALERLFKKTASKPHIFYKFLTDEEVMLKKREPVESNQQERPRDSGAQN